MPVAAAGGFERRYHEGISNTSVLFPFTLIDGRNVIETREHYEATHPGPWGAGRFWLDQEYATLMWWLTDGTFADDTYELRLKGWDRVGDNLVNERILPLCPPDEAAHLVLTIDNRLNPDPFHPTALDHPCVGVHACVTEPDTDFLEVRINGVKQAACATVDASAGGSLEIDFMAHDPNGHLAFYTLQAKYGENATIDLLEGVGGASLSPGPLGAPVPPAAQVGPYYGNPHVGYAFPARLALNQGAVSPTWTGGTVTLTIPDLKEAFPISCCYLLELYAYKRTVVSCNHDYVHYNASHYSLTVIV